MQVTALARNGEALALTGLPLTLKIRRPDGVEHSRVLLPDQGLGGRHLALDLPATAMRGTWRAAIHADPEAPPLAVTLAPHGRPRTRELPPRSPSHDSALPRPTSPPPVSRGGPGLGLARPAGVSPAAGRAARIARGKRYDDFVAGWRRDEPPAGVPYLGSWEWPAAEAS